MFPNSGLKQEQKRLGWAKPELWCVWFHGGEFRIIQHPVPPPLLKKPSVLKIRQDLEAGSFQGRRRLFYSPAAGAPPSTQLQVFRQQREGLTNKGLHGRKEPACEEATSVGP